MYLTDKGGESWMPQKPIRTRSIFQALLLPLFMLLAAEMLILMLVIPVGGLGDRITNNYRNVVTLQTTSQRDYLESYMVNSWSDLTALSDKITQTVQEMLDDGTITLDGLDSESACYTPLLTAVSDDLVSTIYARQVNGVYVILNTEDLDNVSGEVRRPCLYIRDQDPTSASSDHNSDLLLEYAPVGVLSQISISTDNGWQPMFSFEDREEQAFFYETFQNAFRIGTSAPSGRHGYWTASPYLLQGSDHPSISYSVPLILEDGTVIGVVGVELLTSYIASHLPTGELLASEKSAYLVLCCDDDAASEYSVVLNSGGYFIDFAAGEQVKLHPLSVGGYSLIDRGIEYYAEMQPLHLYRNDSVYSHQRWFIVGIVEMGEMFAFANEMNGLLALALILMLVVGVVCMVIISSRLAKPIAHLSDEIATARREGNSDPNLPGTGIGEIDDLSDAFKELTQEILNTSTKFLRIMEMASVELAGYEWREGQNTIYVTGNFFPMLGLEHINIEDIDLETFKEIVEDLRSGPDVIVGPDGSRTYCVVRENGTRYVRAESSQDGDRHVGILEDVTRSMLERIRVEHERDYDVLTGLYNRRAFYRKAGQVFSGIASVNYAAMVMMDLDNLKITNDRFGHDWGDKYLRQTAMCLMDNTPQDAVCARISGDEFYILLYNYTDRTDLERDVDHLMTAIRESVLHMPDGQVMRLSVSAGVAWYPEDSTSLQELIKYADFAMYQAKGTSKGTIRRFDAQDYSRDIYLIQGRGELNELIEKESVAYHFQPIYSALTARPEAYEALMRVNMPTLKSPDVVLRLATVQGKLSHIERITMFKASEAYQKLCDEGRVSQDALLFLNSLSGQCLSDEDALRFHEQFGDLQPRIVMEITESEYLDVDALEAKRRQPGFSGMFALDDYGSGYNGEKNLLLLQPKYVKVDVVFIRGIDTNIDRQQLVSSLVTYAHGRSMKVVAEGIETGAELQKVLELGVDLLQGYFLSRPGAVPGAIAPEAESIIVKFREGKTE